MDTKKIIKYVEKYREETSKWLTFISLFISIIGWIDNRVGTNGINIPIVDLFLKNSKIFFIGFIFFGFVWLFMKIYKIEKRLRIAFIEKLKKDLHINWDFKGDWKIEDGELSVTESEEGGISKTGSLWENYEFEFETKILNKFSGWIVRAQDLNNYLMFQINNEYIRPHLRLSQPRFKNIEEDTFEISEIRVGWKLFGNFPHYKNIKNRWFKIKTIVRGSRVDIFVDGENVYHADNLLTIPFGKVGFRESGEEHAHFRNIEVHIID